MRRICGAVALVLLLASVAYAAIDTENKRRNTYSIRSMRRLLPVADGDIGAGDRAMLARSWRGVADDAEGASTGTTSGNTSFMSLLCRRRR